MHYFIKVFCFAIFIGQVSQASKLITIDQDQNRTTIIITSPVDFHGFAEAHERGIKGHNQTIAFIENTPTLNHPQFQENQITLFDVSHRANYYGQDISTWRRSKEDEETESRFNLDWILDNHNIQDHYHGNHVIGIAVGQPGLYNYVLNDNTDKKKNDIKLSFKGGCSPLARVINYDYSNFYPKQEWNWLDNPIKKHFPTGVCVYTYEDLYTKIELSGYTKIAEDIYRLKEAKKVKYEEINDLISLRKETKNKIDAMSENERNFYKETKIDDSLMQAFRAFFKSEARILNASLQLMPLCDPLNSYKIPSYIVEEIAEGLEKNDKILVLAANNECINLSSSLKFNYFKDFFYHSSLKDRSLIAINIVPYEDEFFCKNLGTVLLKDQTVLNIGLGNQSNYPGSDLKEFALCALGKTISGSESLDNKCQNLFSVGNGTSMAAPVISSLCALMAEKYPHFNGKEIVSRIKETAIKFGNPDYTGCGFLYAPSSLGL
ncbi:MAG: S8 family serine peptidase [Janthinobacterium lividum]